MRINEKGTLGGMIDTEMWENRMNLEIHECGNGSVEREWWNASGQGGKRKAKWRLAKKKTKNEMSEETSAKREEVLKSNERATSGAHQSDVDGNKKK
jgi:hypothetical protein